MYFLTPFAVCGVWLLFVNKLKLSESFSVQHIVTQLQCESSTSFWSPSFHNHSLCFLFKDFQSVCLRRPLSPSAAPCAQRCLVVSCRQLTLQFVFPQWKMDLIICPQTSSQNSRLELPASAWTEWDTFTGPSKPAHLEEPMVLMCECRVDTGGVVQDVCCF